MSARYGIRELPGRPQWPALLRRVGLLALLGCALWATDALSLYMRGTSAVGVDVGGRGDQNLVSGVYAAESDASGATYRWARASSAIGLRDLADIPNAELRLTIGGLPPAAGATQPVRVDLDTTTLVVPVMSAPRQYYLLPPAAALRDGTLMIRMQGATFAAPPDPRLVALRLDAADLSWARTTWPLPTPRLLLVQFALVLVWLGMGWRLGLPRWSLALIGACGVALLAWMTGYELATAQAWQMRALAQSALVLALLWNAAPLLQRLTPELGTRAEVRWLLAITALALVVRIVVLMYPPFGSHDLLIHRTRLLDVQRGQLFLFDTPSEFASQPTTVPPAFYIVASPLSLLTVDPAVALQGLYALLEGSSALLVAIVARQLGASARATRGAAIVAAALPIQMTILWWGFGPQMMGQWLLLLLLVFLTYRPTRTPVFWLAAALTLTLALLTHNGAVVLGGVAVAGYAGLGWLIAGGRRDLWLRWIGVLGASAAVAVLLLYADSLLTQLNVARDGAGAVPIAAEEAARVGRVWGGLRSSFRPLGYAGTGLSFVALVGKTRGWQRALIGAWLLSAAAFLAVDLVSGLQVRYAYFCVPFLCIGTGLVVAWLQRRGLAGRVAALLLLAVIVGSGTRLLVTGVFWDVKPTLTALTH